MIAFANTEYQKLEQTLNKIANDSDTPLSQAERSIDVILQSIDSLKVNINSRPFNNVGEEILFFKQMIPYYDVVHICTHKTLICFQWRADRWFAPDVETCIYD